jgi:hypothetical protein
LRQEASIGRFEQVEYPLDDMNWKVSHPALAGCRSSLLHRRSPCRHPFRRALRPATPARLRLLRGGRSGAASSLPAVSKRTPMYPCSDVESLAGEASDPPRLGARLPPLPTDA